MSNLKDIKQKMTGIGKTSQITSAMKMMAIARLGKAAKKLNLSHSYIAKLEQIVRRIQSEIKTDEVVKTKDENIETSVAFIVVSGERGLCGGYNSEFNKFASSVISEHEANCKKIILVGKKGMKTFSKGTHPVIAHFPDLSRHHDGAQLFKLSELVYKIYSEKEVNEIFIIYSTFLSPVKKYFVAPRLLPLDPEAKSIFKDDEDKEQADEVKVDFEFDPSPIDIYERLIPMYVQNVIHRALIETGASEQSARVAAMTSASDRAQEIIEELKLDFNRTRQAIITQEISEIISGLDA